MDYEIKLEKGVKPSVLALYRMALLELKELRKQLTELLDVEYIRSSKALLGAPVIF